MSDECNCEQSVELARLLDEARKLAEEWRDNWLYVAVGLKDICLPWEGE